MKKIIPYIVLFFTMAAYSQSYQWLKTVSIGAANTQTTGYVTVSDHSGNIYFSGFKDTPIYYNDLLGNIYYNKYNTNGDVLFSKVFTGKCNPYAIKSDSQGNIIIAIGYLDSVTIDTTFIAAPNNNMNYLVAKLDTNGNLLWYKRLSITDADVADFRAIATDGDDAIYIGYDSFMDSYITKYSASGSELLNIEQQNVNRITSVAVDTEGNIYAAGGCAGIDSKYAGVDVPTDFNYNSYVVKYSPQGTYQWLKYIDDITCPDSPTVLANTPDEIYFSSYLFVNTGFDDIEIEGPGDFSEDIFISKLNASGNFQWVREASGTGSVTIGNRNYLNLDSMGNIYFTGSTSGTLNWGNGISTSIISTTIQNDALVLKYNSDGNVLFAKTAGGPSEDKIDCITINELGDIFISGIATGNVNFDTVEHLAPEFESYPFLAKISHGTAGIKIPERENIFLYPNPTSDNIEIKGIDAGIKGIIITTLGQKVIDFNTTPAAPISIGSLSAGIYFIKIEGNKPLKFIKQ
ncbi:T9SS type A sorting domain-containing protein [Flavobacterium cerinum]|uniref:T9SS type A sorting domain-containing protein n=1 Tax=Flavobacterium cerinum TaxID=2502784 RepID=A0A3S3Q7Q9_9FLAO|nr:T9SS type A sorting domain-containing protein [Flavobacterium cerinum]RWW92006.1 T9SS type A sorting domain-containing protein [Flavobacterium cerinum]